MTIRPAGRRQREIGGRAKLEAWLRDWRPRLNVIQFSMPVSDSPTPGDGGTADPTPEPSLVASLSAAYGERMKIAFITGTTERFDDETARRGQTAVLDPVTVPAD